jgi:hypothetical protein
VILFPVVVAAGIIVVTAAKELAKAASAAQPQLQPVRVPIK